MSLFFYLLHGLFRHPFHPGNIIAQGQPAITELHRYHQKLSLLFISRIRDKKIISAFLKEIDPRTLHPSRFSSEPHRGNR